MATAHASALGYHASRDLVQVDGAWIEVPGGNYINLGRGFPSVSEWLALRYARERAQGRIFGFVGDAHMADFNTVADYGVTPLFTALPGAVRLNEIDPYRDPRLLAGSTFSVGYDDLARLEQQVAGAVQFDEWVALSTSIPPHTIDESRFDLDMVLRLQGLGANVLFDSHGPQVKRVLESTYVDKSRLIAKPNLGEFSDAVGCSIDPLNDIALLDFGEKWMPKGLLFLSMGKLGAFAYYQGFAWRVQANLPKGVARIGANGCGDSAAAGLLAAFSSSPDPWNVSEVLFAIIVAVLASVANLSTHVPAHIPLGLMDQLMDPKQKLLTVTPVTR